VVNFCLNESAPWQRPLVFFVFLNLQLQVLTSWLKNPWTVLLPAEMGVAEAAIVTLTGKPFNYHSCLTF
jgi:hypothetical protein